jgi:single-strand DNA-binding protein
MASDVNQITVSGNLGADPEMRYTPTGKAITTFKLATNRTYMKGDEKVQETLWTKVECWGKTAEIVDQYLKKGRKVLVIGTLKPQRAYQKTDGTTGYSGYEINASEVHFLDRAPQGNGEAQHEEAPVEEEVINF